MGTGFSKKKKQAKMLQQQMEMMQQKMSDTESTGSAGNGLVEITLKGNYEMKSIKIKPECVDPEDIEALQDLIRSAYQQAVQKLSNDAEMPGFSFPNF